MNEQAKDYKLQGAALMGAANYKEAQKFFEKALEIEESAEGFVDLGNACASNGDYANAIDAFTKALNYEPDNGEILFDIGSVYLLQERLKKCIEYYNRAEEKGFDNVRLYINFAAIYQALGDQQMELRNYTKAIDKNPLLADLYVKKAMLLIDMQKYEAALDTLDELRKLFPDAFESYDLAARVYLMQGDTAYAHKILREGIAKFPNDINLKLSETAIYIEEKKLDEAEKMLSDIKKMTYAEMYFREITMHEVTIASIRNQPDLMKEKLLSVVKEEKEACDEQARFMLMMTCNLLGDYQIAYEQAEVLERQQSNSAFAVSGLYYKGEFLKKLNRDTEATAQFKMAVKKLRKLSMSNRTFYEVYIYRALAHKQLKEFDKAIEMAEFISELQPDRADGHMILADIYKEMGDEDKSQEQFDIAQSLSPELLGRSE